MTNLIKSHLIYSHLQTMLQTIQGIFRAGKVELKEIPQGVTESEVFVTFLNSETSITTNQITYGMFSGSIQSTEADFQEAEYAECKEQ